MDVSVVMPCYNAGPWVQEALHSIAAQNCAPAEVIVVDDGSTDDSIKQIESSGVEVRLICTQRANGAGARNAGIEIATGDWIAFLDADDLWLPDHLQRAVDLLEGTDDVAHLGHSFLFNNNNPDQLRYERLPWSVTEPTAGLSHRQFIEMYAQAMRFSMTSTLVRRQRLVEIGGFDEQLVRRHDINMWLRAIAEHTWALNPEPTVAYRVDTPGAISRPKASADYYYLLALLKSRDAYQGAAMSNIIQTLAGRAVSSALSYGDENDLQRAVEIAWPHLSRKAAITLSLARCAPGLFRFIQRRRHQWIHWRRRSR